MPVFSWGFLLLKRKGTGDRMYFLPSYYNTISEKKSDVIPASVEGSEAFIKSIRTFTLEKIFFIIIPAIIRHYLPFFRTNYLKIVNIYIINLIKSSKRKEKKLKKLHLINLSDMICWLLLLRPIHPVILIKPKEMMTKNYWGLWRMKKFVGIWEML